MQLGFVSAILPDLSLQEVAAFACSADYSCVELMCWPPSKAERRYAGVTHVDATRFGPAEAAEVNQIMAAAGVSSLPASPSAARAARASRIPRIARVAKRVAPNMNPAATAKRNGAGASGLVSASVVSTSE